MPEQISREAEPSTQADRKPTDFYQVLSFRFGVQADSPEMRRHVASVLGRFAVDDLGSSASSDGDWGVSSYHLRDAGAGDKSRYRVHFNGTWVRGSGGFGDCLNQFYWHVSEEAYTRTDRFLLIHAGAVVSDNGTGVLLPADSGSGKTTLVTALVRSGFGFLTDEAAVIDPDDLVVHPFPRALTIKASARDLSPDLDLKDEGRASFNGYRHVDPAVVRPDSVAGPARVGLVVFPQYVPDAPTDLTPLSAAAGCASLGRHALNLPTWGNRALPVLARLAQTAPAYRLVSGRLGEAVDAVAGLVAT